MAALAATLSDAELARVEDAVDRALDAADPTGLAVLGYGEISVTIGWPTDEPVWACKRLPPFPDGSAYTTYRALVEEYVDRLGAAGVCVVATDVRSIERPDGSVVGYLVQPALDPACLGPVVLRGASPADGHPLVDGIVEAVFACNDGRTGIDAQITNWAWIDGRACNLDMNTPFLYDARGRPRIDVGLFIAALPWVLRATQRRTATKIASRWRQPGWALFDLAMNLYKDGLEDWIPVVLDAANPWLMDPIDPTRLKPAYDKEARLWVQMHRLKRIDRWWQRNVRRRRYEFLVPEQTDYAR